MVVLCLGLLAVGAIFIAGSVSVQVNVPKQRKTFCKSCKCHSQFKVTQYKAGKASLYAQGELIYYPCCMCDFIL